MAKRLKTGSCHDVGQHKTPLYQAIQSRDLIKIKSLLEQQEDPNGICEGRPLLNTAVSSGDLNIVKLLVDGGANINVSNSQDYEFTALQLAIQMFFFQIINFFLTYGTNINAINKDRETCLHSVIKYHDYDNSDLLEKLIKLGADFNAQNIHGLTVLSLAAERGNLCFVNKLLELGANIEIQDNDGRTALHIAVECKEKSIVKALLKAGSDVNIKTKSSGYTPLEVALFGREIEDDDRIQRKIIYILKRHVLKLKTADLFVNESNLTLIRDGEIWIKDFQEEIAWMKRMKLHGTCVSFYHSMLISVHKLAVLLQNVDTSKIQIQTNQFPLYGNMLKRCFTKAEIRKPLLKQADAVGNLIFSSHVPELCFRHIISFLQNEDLKNLIDSSKLL